MPLEDIFRIDPKYWNSQQVEEVELFFTLNHFFNEFYENQDFNEVVNFTFYTKLQPENTYHLDLNKRSQVIILLSGTIDLFRKFYDRELKKKIKEKEEILAGNYARVATYNHPYEVINIKNDAVVRCTSQTPAEFLYIPTILCESHRNMVQNRRIQLILNVLNLVFALAAKKDLLKLAEKSCTFKELKMNNFVYRAGSKPQNCYILISGNVKLESSGFSAKKMLDTIIIGEKSIFGDKDLNEQFRLQNAQCCSSHCRVLQIQKEAYNDFISKNQQLNPVYAFKLKQILSKSRTHSKSAMESYTERHTLPRIQRFHANVKPQQQEKIQKQLVKNCHILINLTPKKRGKSSFRMPDHIQKDYSINQFQHKMKLFHRLQSNVQPLDISHKFF